MLKQKSLDLKKSSSFTSSVLRCVAAPEGASPSIPTAVCPAPSRQPGLGFRARAAPAVCQPYPARQGGSSSTKPAFKSFPFLWLFLVQPLFVHFHFQALLCATSRTHPSTDCPGWILRLQRNRTLREGEAGRGTQGWFIFWPPFFQLSPFPALPYGGVMLRV